MKFSKIILASVLMLGFLPASAQDAAEAEEKPQYDFKPHFYLDVLPLGGQYTIGELDKFGDLFSYNAQINFGQQVNPNWGWRLSLNAMTSKAGSEPTEAFSKKAWKWHYLSPTADLVFGLSNIIGGYNPNRWVNVDIFAGVGVNYAWSNGEAGDALAEYELERRVAQIEWMEGYEPMRYYWNHNNWSLAGRFGALADIRVTDNWRIIVEANANIVNDKYNSKKAGNSDWFFNGLAGVRYHFGEYVSKRAPRKCNSETIYVEKPVVKEVIKEVEKVVVKYEPLRRDVFFTIGSSKISNAEMQKVQDIVLYMNEHPQSKVSITGYADSATGNATINAKYAEQRAQAVYDVLVKTHNIDPARITKDSKGGQIELYGGNPAKNRVAICIAGE